jgi:predicted enzyme related to lactoylglutathione lyase
VTTIQDDAVAAAAFYRGVLGWDTVRGEDGGHPFFSARLRGREVAGIGSTAAVDPRPPAAWITHIAVEDADATTERARAAGATVLAEPFDIDPVGRLAVLNDPTGALVNLWQPYGRQGAELVNEPGAWAMSALQTPEPERAAAFYGEVFGWTTEALGPDITLFRLPGYVGGEPAQPVSREVVAAMMRADAGTPSAWAVDFWVEDVDAAAAAVASLGGTVLAGPMDAPVGRTAVVADPEGVPFSVSRTAP